MSVLKNKRSYSKLEYYHTARKMRRDITALFLRDFGVRNLKVNKKNFLDQDLMEKVVEDYPRMSYFFNKYTKMEEEFRAAEVVSEYPTWLVFRFRDEVMDYLKQLMDNITMADTIYPTTMEQYTERKKYQTMAIGNCEQLIQCFQYIIEVLPVDANKLIPYIDMITSEINHLKVWRKSTNKFLKSINS